VILWLKLESLEQLKSFFTQFRMASALEELFVCWGPDAAFKSLPCLAIAHRLLPLELPEGLAGQAPREDAVC